MVIADAAAVEPGTALTILTTPKMARLREWRHRAARPCRRHARRTRRPPQGVPRTPSDEPDGKQLFRPVPPLENFRVVVPSRKRPLALPIPFSRSASRTTPACSVDPQRCRLHLAGMLDHAASQRDFASALGWKIGKWILPSSGTTKAVGPAPDRPRARPDSCFPLPSIEAAQKIASKIGAIRRVLVTVSRQCEKLNFCALFAHRRSGNSPM